MSEISDILTREIMQSPEMDLLIDRKVEQKVSERLVTPEYFTRDQLAGIWKVSKQTVDRMSDEALNDHGFTRIKIGNSVRFERI
jgi:hypothetical protein